MKIEIAKSAGYCFGVKRAMELAEQLADSGKRVCTLGEIIHNPHAVAMLEKKGVSVVNSPEDVPQGASLVIRSHGVAKKVYEQIESLGIDCHDATCPFVSRIHRIVEKFPEDAVVLLAGNPNHAEVLGIIGHCKAQVNVFSTAEEAEKILQKIEKNGETQVFMLSQTTFSRPEWEKSAMFAKKVCTNINIFDTICKATVTRQTEAAKLAQRSDLMVVVGGRHSSNTAKLWQICSGYCASVFIESPQELYDYDFSGVGCVGVTAGASTPDCIIKEVRKIMSEIVNNQEELSFEELLNQSLENTYKNGDRVTGIVIDVKPTEVIVDIGTKHACYVPLSELTNDPNAKTEDCVKVGEEITLQIVRINDVDGVCTLSKKRVDAVAGFEKVMNAAETGEVLHGVVTEIIKGGVLALSNGVKVFIPASQATRSKNDPLEPLMKQEVDFKILEVNRQRRRAVGSIRAVLDGQKKVLEDQFWNEVEVGKTYKGVVKSLTSYGAFVDLGGVDGMVHKSELSWARIKQPSDVVAIGDVLEVYVKDIDVEKRKISLGYKKNEENPWYILEQNYAVGSVTKVKIVSMTPFGAFAQIIPGVDGLIHISQISNERINQPQDVLAVGQEVDAKITELDFDKKRISLSIRALLDDSAEEAQTEETAE
ncbi:MAG: bifunctional 4-hydroxy-3-methylbut-2-enyl diphosphate reductase/30S ribosomal protein S1 [Oscillospiraceae bacterium]|nr:bifunctional 4-hydroxy-3-methylbut-2-enyl diphosphate reductase/30S ribosomal protein S1 [Oscillospiraceae bacterium]